MTPNPVSVSASATVRKARAFLTDKGVSGAPVIDEAGRPVGVLTQTDLVVHDRELPDGGDPGESRARDLMTPAVFTVRPDAPAAAVVEQLLGFNVHRLFVVDDAGLLVGVVSAFDVLRGLRPSGAG
jgi:CBS domain-containing protein